MQHEHLESIQRVVIIASAMFPTRGIMVVVMMALMMTISPAGVMITFTRQVIKQIHFAFLQSSESDMPKKYGAQCKIDAGEPFATRQIYLPIPLVQQ